MIPLSTASSGGITWSKISCARGYELKLNGEVVGTLRKASFFSSNYIGEAVDGQWTFRRSGWLGSSQIVDSSSQQQIATFKSQWGRRGPLTFADGQRFLLERKGWLRPVWSVLIADDEPIVQVRVREKTVDLKANGAGLGNRLTLLILFAWYLILQVNEDAAAASVASIAAS